MQNNQSKLNTILLVVLIVLVGVGISMLYNKNEKSDLDPWSQSESAMMGSENNVQTKDNINNLDHAPQPQGANNGNINSTLKLISANNMSVSVPNDSKYTFDTQTPHGMGNIPTLKVAYNNQSFIYIHKFSTQAAYEEMIPSGPGTDYVLVNSNYPISGTTGHYYTGNPEIRGKEIFIAVPSKLTIIDIGDSDFVGIPLPLFNQIIASIQI